MRSLHFLFVLSSISLSIAQAPSLLDALKSSGATKFAALIESDPTISTVYLSNQVQTVFAPSDDAQFPPNLLGKRQTTTPAQEQMLLLHVTQKQNTLAGMSVPPGAPLATQDKAANLNGNPQSVVSDTRNIPASSIPRRWSNITTPSLLKIYSGLGNNISITRADIPYNGGLIQIVNNFFTLPESLSQTAVANGHTTFTSLTNSTNMTASLNAMPGITCFIPTNAAFASADATSPTSSTVNLLSGHVIPNFVGYLPLLKNGSTFTTQAGTTVTVTVKGSDFYINNAKILNANNILENGVAHVVDQIITPTKAPVLVGAGSSIMGTGAHFAVLASSAVLLLNLVF